MNAAVNPKLPARTNNDALPRQDIAAAPMVATATPPQWDAKNCAQGSGAYNAAPCVNWRATIAAEESAQAAYSANFIAVGSILLTLATLIFLYFSIRQTNRGLEQGRQANEIFDDTRRKELRAYIVPKDQFIADLARDRVAAFGVKLQNSGQTPAHDVRCISIMWATTEDVDDFRFIFRGKPIASKLSRDVIGPGDFKIHINKAQGQTGVDFDAIVAGNLNVIYAGVISYRDIFGKRHLSTFRQFLVHDGNPTTSFFDLMSCATGNRGN